MGERAVLFVLFVVFVVFVVFVLFVLFRLARAAPLRWLRSGGSAAEKKSLFDTLVGT